MPNYLSQFRSSTVFEKLEKNGDDDGRTITVNVSDFGNILGGGGEFNYAESSAQARTNAMIFIKAYEYAMRIQCSMNVEIRINVPAGDYFFPDNDDYNNFIVIGPPQGGHIGIFGAGRSGTRPMASLDTIFGDSKQLLKEYYRTRFHFLNNGFSLPGNIGSTTRSSMLFNEVAFFGSSDGFATMRSSTIKRAFAGSYRLQYCAIHGFTTEDSTLNTPNAGNSYGILATGASSVAIYSVIIAHCGRAFFAIDGGSISCSSYPSDADRDVICQIAWEGVLSGNSGTIRVGTGSTFRSVNTAAGANKFYAYNNGTIVAKSATYDGFAVDTSSTFFTQQNSGIMQVGSGPDGG